jgi:hypothetical protein
MEITLLAHAARAESTRRPRSVSHARGMLACSARSSATAAVLRATAYMAFRSALQVRVTAFVRAGARKAFRYLDARGMPRTTTEHWCLRTTAGRTSCQSAQHSRLPRATQKHHAPHAGVGSMRLACLRRPRRRCCRSEQRRRGGRSSRWSGNHDSAHHLRSAMAHAQAQRRAAAGVQASECSRSKRSRLWNAGRSVRLGRKPAGGAASARVRRSTNSFRPGAGNERSARRQRRCRREFAAPRRTARRFTRGRERLHQRARHPACRVRASRARMRRRKGRWRRGRWRSGRRRRRRVLLDSQLQDISLSRPRGGRAEQQHDGLRSKRRVSAARCAALPFKLCSACSCLNVRSEHGRTQQRGERLHALHRLAQATRGGGGPPAPLRRPHVRAVRVCARVCGGRAVVCAQRLLPHVRVQPRQLRAQEQQRLRNACTQRRCRGRRQRPRQRNHQLRLHARCALRVYGARLL